PCASCDAGSNVVVVLEQRFEATPDGSVWGPGTCGATFWARYLEVFDTVTVAARVHRVPRPSRGLERCSVARVDFAAIPPYTGPWQFLRQFGVVKRAAIGALAPFSSIIIRIPSPIGGCLVPH